MTSIRTICSDTRQIGIRKSIRVLAVEGWTITKNERDTAVINDDNIGSNEMIAKNCNRLFI
jgi:hypothetical protein